MKYEYKDLDKVCKRAVDHHGIESQIDMAIEEMAELIVALKHFRRGRNDGSEALQEMADVFIMLHQIRTFFDAMSKQHGGRLGMFDTWVDYKLTRLNEKLNLSGAKK